MFETSLDILWLSLALGFGVLLISISVLVWQVIGTLKRVNRLADTVEHVLDLVDTYLRMPASVIYRLMKWWKNK